LQVAQDCFPSGSSGELIHVAVDFEECYSTGSALILLGLIKLLEVGFHFSTFSI
jgi:hypothetical protein